MSSLNQHSENLYLKMLAEAIGTLSRNNGAQRKDIWKYCMEKFTDSVKYVEFLQTINKLIKGGKLEKNDYGYYWIQKEVYQELYKDCIEGKLSVGSKAAQTEMGHYKSSVTKSLGRLSVSNRKLTQFNALNAHKTCGAMSAMNGKNLYGAQDVPAKKQSRDKQYDQIGLYGKKKSINSGGAKPGKGSRGSKGLSQVTMPCHFENPQMVIDSFYIPAPIDRVAQNESNLQIECNQIGGQENNGEIKKPTKYTRSRKDARSEAPYDFDEASVSLSELPDKNVDPMQEIKMRVRAEILMYQQKRRDKKNREKRRNQELQSQMQESQCDMQSNLEQPQNDCQEQEKARVMTRNQQAQAQHTADTSAQTAKNHNTKLGKKVEGNTQKQKTDDARSDIGEPPKPVNGCLGFRSRSHSQSQVSKTDRTVSDSYDQYDCTSTGQLDKKAKPIFGFQSPTKREGDTSRDLSYSNNQETITQPEDLYPASMADASRQDDVTEENDNDEILEEEHRELSLQDEQFAPHEQFGSEELNMNSEDERVMNEVHGGDDDYTTDGPDHDDGKSLFSYYDAGGAVTRHKKRQLDFEMEASQMSVMSDCSRYSLRPRNREEVAQIKRQRQQEKQPRLSQNANAGKKSHAAGKVTSTSKSPVRTTKKAYEKYQRKQKGQGVQKAKEFKQPNSKGQRNTGQDDVLSQKDQGCSLRATLTGGFGNYHTRNYSHFQDAMSQVVTRNQFQDIVQSRPQVRGQVNDYLQKTCRGPYDKGLFQANPGSNFSNISKCTISGQKRRNPYHSNDRLSQQSKIQKTPAGDFEKRVTRNHSHSAMTAMSTRSHPKNADLFTMQKQKKQIQQQMALDKVMKKSTCVAASANPLHRESSRQVPEERPQNQDNLNISSVAKNVDLGISIQKSQLQIRATRSSNYVMNNGNQNSQSHQNSLKRSSVSPGMASRHVRSNTRQGLNDRTAVDNGANVKRVEVQSQHQRPQAIVPPVQPTKATGAQVVSSAVQNGQTTTVASRQKQNEKMNQAQLSQRSRNPQVVQAPPKGSTYQQGAQHPQDPRKECPPMNQTFTQSGRPTQVTNYQELHKQGKNENVVSRQMMFIAGLYGQKVGNNALPSQPMNAPIPTNIQHHSQSTSISGSDNTMGFSAQKLHPAGPGQNYPMNQSQRTLRPNPSQSNAPGQMVPKMQGTHGIATHPNWNQQFERESKVNAMMKLNTSSAMKIQTTNNNQEFCRN